MQRGPRSEPRRAGPSPGAPGELYLMAIRTEKTQITRALLSLREQILSGEFSPGERMSELPLVDRLGVSRTPLRLALAALEHEGLLQRLPGGGYAVREFTQAEIADAIEIRGVLEGTAARFAAERGTTVRQMRTLKEINDRIGALVHCHDYSSARWQRSCRCHSPAPAPSYWPRPS